jgi:hypothetical protein
VAAPGDQLASVPAELVLAALWPAAALFRGFMPRRGISSNLVSAADMMRHPNRFSKMYKKNQLVGLECRPMSRSGYRQVL